MSSPAASRPTTSKLIAFDVGSGGVQPRRRVPLRAGARRGRIVRSSTDAFVDLDDLALRRRGRARRLLRLAALGVRGAALDLDARTVSVAEIVTRDGRVRAARDAQGVVDLTDAGLRRRPPAAAAAPPPARAAAAAPNQRRPRAWTVAVARFDLEKWGARFEDRAVTPTATLTVDPIALHVTNLSTAPGREAGRRSAPRRQQDRPDPDHRHVDAAAGGGQPALRPARAGDPPLPALLPGPGEPDRHRRHDRRQGPGRGEGRHRAPRRR